MSKHLARRALVVGIAAITAACGSIGAPAKPPSAQEVLAKPMHSGLKDAHFLVSGKIASQGITVDITGDGQLVYGSSAAGRFKFQTSMAGQQVSFEQISTKGTDYTLTTPGNGKWTAKASSNGIGPDSFVGASGFRYVGEETLPQGKAWHARAQDKDGNPFDGWVRESDGYPVKYTLTQQSNSLVLTFDRYNTGSAISAPPASQVVQG